MQLKSNDLSLFCFLQSTVCLRNKRTNIHRVLILVHYRSPSLLLLLQLLLPHPPMCTLFPGYFVYQLVPFLHHSGLSSSWLKIPTYQNPEDKLAFVEAFSLLKSIMPKTRIAFFVIVLSIVAQSIARLRRRKHELHRGRGTLCLFLRTFSWRNHTKQTHTHTQTSTLVAQR